MSTNQFDPTQYGEADRRAVDPPIPVDAATGTPGGQLDWWVLEHCPRLEWFGRVRSPDGRQRWIKASDLRRASSSQPCLKVGSAASRDTYETCFTSGCVGCS